MYFECVSSKSALYVPGKKYRVVQYTDGSVSIIGEFDCEYDFDVLMKSAHRPSGIVIALFK